MIELKNFSGKMNLDTEKYRVPLNDFTDALNITRDAQGAGQDKVVSNIVGNTLVSYTLPVGTNKRIGSRPDLIRNRIYAFIWNSNGYHSIIYYNKSTNTISKLIISKTDSAGVDILGFNPSWKINHIDIIYRDEGDLIYWTDGLNRPFIINETTAIAGTYGTNWLYEYITVARRMPMIAPVCTYQNDATVAINNLRKTLYEFRYVYYYKDFTRSTYSPYGKLFAPTSPDDLAKDIDPTKNNRIDVVIQTGGKDVIKIEVVARLCLGTTFSDDFRVDTLVKADLGIADDSLYTYQFFNNSTYPTLNVRDTGLIYSYIPRKAFTQALPNGNVVSYANITEGFNKSVTFNVTASVTSFLNSTSQPLYVLSYLLGRSWGFMFLGAPVTGDVITLDVTVTHDDQTTDLETFIYTVLGGDTLTSIQTAFIALINGTSSPALQCIALSDTNGTTGIKITSTVPTDILSGIATIGYATTPTTDEVNIAAYKHKSKYRFIMVYFTNYGEVVESGTQDTMLVSMPEMDTTGGTEMKIPNIAFSVNHQPPLNATYFTWARSLNLTVAGFTSLVSASTLKDTDYGYIEITNLQTNINGYSAYDFNVGDRVRIIGEFVSGAAGAVQMYDFPISDYVTSPTISGTLRTGLDFIKIPYNAVLANFGTTMHYYCEVYTPAINPTSVNNQVFYEFGETYQVGNPGLSTRYHFGKRQNQTIGGGAQPAIFDFARGDVYIRKRLFPITTNLQTINTMWLVNRAVSDLYPSNIVGNGRAFVLEPDAKETRFPVMQRFGGYYENDTSVNQTNIFYFDSFDSYDRSLGDIQKLFIEGKYEYVFQKFDIGVVPILQQIIKDTSGNPLEANSDQLLNRIQYPYKGRVGIGDVPESFAYYRNAKYGIDSNKGVAWRLSNDGLILLSVLYQCNNFFVEKTAAFRKDLNTGIPPAGFAYTGDPTIYGVFDFYTNKYIIAFEEINRYSNPTTRTFHQDPYTLIFNETRDEMEGFECKTSYFPEGMDSLGTTLVSWKDGKLWTHNSSTYCNFYNIQYDAFIQAVFNIAPLEKKTPESLTEMANTIWTCPEISTQVMSYGTIPQQSELITQDIVEIEGQYHATFLRDSNSNGGLINGEILKGNYVVIKFKVANASNFVFLNGVSFMFKDSPLTNK